VSNDSALAQVKRDAEELQRETINTINRSDVPTIAAAAFVQAAFADGVCEAVLALLKFKNIISEAELQKALGDSYHAKAVKLRGAGGAIIPASHPMIRPNGSF
jgi:hypothetical protein